MLVCLYICMNVPTEKRCTYCIMLFLGEGFMRYSRMIRKKKTKSSPRPLNGSPPTLPVCYY